MQSFEGSVTEVQCYHRSAGFGKGAAVVVWARIESGSREPIYAWVANDGSVCRHSGSTDAHVDKVSGIYCNLLESSVFVVENDGLVLVDSVEGMVLGKHVRARTLRKILVG